MNPDKAEEARCVGMVADSRELLKGVRLAHFPSKETLLQNLSRSTALLLIIDHNDRGTIPMRPALVIVTDSRD
jgi:hypothetical protein